MYYVRSHLDFVLVLLSLLVLLPNRLSSSAATAFSDLLWGCSSIHDSPFSRLELELSRISYHHAGDFGILWVFRLGGAEEGLERDEGGLDGQDR